MKAITIWQPWASLVAFGEKRVETRHWFTGYRGPIAVHAAKTWHKPDAFRAVFGDGWEDHGEPGWRPEPTPVRTALKRHGVTSLADLPLGAVVATARLVACVRFTGASTYRLPDGSEVDVAPEAAFGDFTPGRFGWVLSDVAPLAVPYAVRGQQGLWDVDLPVEALAS